MTNGLAALSTVSARMTLDGVLYPNVEAMVADAAKMMTADGKAYVTVRSERVVVTRWDRKRERRELRQTTRDLGIHYNGIS